MKAVKSARAWPGLAWTYSVTGDLTEEELAGLTSHHQLPGRAQFYCLHGEPDRQTDGQGCIFSVTRNPYLS